MKLDRSVLVGSLNAPQVNGLHLGSSYKGRHSEVVDDLGYNHWIQNTYFESQVLSN